jgi:hypothetical protein
MNMRKVRRLRSRRWDSVHKSWNAVLDGGSMWPIRHTKPCKSYSAWCSDCNAVRFISDHNRFPHNVDEFYAFEDYVQIGEQP